MTRKQTIVGGIRLGQDSLPITDEQPIPLVRKIRHDTGRTDVVQPRSMGIAVPPKKTHDFGGW